MEREFELATRRDREGSFESQIVKKHQVTISDEIEEKILSIYVLGMSYKDIKSYIEEIYQISISTATINTITDKIMSKVKEFKEKRIKEIVKNNKEARIMFYDESKFGLITEIKRRWTAKGIKAIIPYQQKYEYFWH